MVEDHHWLAATIARGFGRTSEPADDLLQVALVGLVKAADRFDPDYGATFTAYASVTIRGELRRHFRDHGWAVRVPRRLQELRYEVRAATDALSSRHGRSPTTQEVAEYLHVHSDNVIDALCADGNYRSRSLDERTGDGPSIGERAGTTDPRFESVDAADAFFDLTAACPPRLRTILHLRYIDGLQQAEIAAHVGISQVHVSRLLAQAHRLLRLRLQSVAPPHVPASR